MCFFFFVFFFCSWTFFLLHFCLGLPPSLFRCVLQDAICKAGGHIALVEALKVHHSDPDATLLACRALAQLADGNDATIAKVTSMKIRGWWGDGVWGLLMRVRRQVGKTA